MDVAPMDVAIVSTLARPDLVPLTARWRWQEFYRARGVPFAEVLAQTERALAAAAPLPRTLVLIAGGVPVGTASLAAEDMTERPDLTPWLAGVVVAPHARGQGHATRLVGAVEAEAVALGFRTLWLYTDAAESLYARAGWQLAERIGRGARAFALMRRSLQVTTAIHPSDDSASGDRGLPY